MKCKKKINKKRVCCSYTTTSFDEEKLLLLLCARFVRRRRYSAERLHVQWWWRGGGWAAGITRDATLRLCRNRRRSYARYFCAPAPVTLDDGHIAQTAFFDTADISLKKIIISITRKTKNNNKPGPGSRVAVWYDNREIHDVLRLCAYTSNGNVLPRRNQCVLWRARESKNNSNYYFVAQSN